MTATDKIEPVVLADPRIDPSHFILEGIDTSLDPLFTVSEVAKFFFARSPHWIRWRERRGDFVLDGDPKCSHLIKLGTTDELYDPNIVEVVEPTVAVETAAPVALFVEPGFVDGGEVLDADIVAPEADAEPDAVKPQSAFNEHGVCIFCGGRAIGMRRTEKGARTYTLADVELITHSLGQRGEITAAQMRHSLAAVRNLAEMYGYR